MEKNNDYSKEAEAGTAATGSSTGAEYSKEEGSTTYLNTNGDQADIFEGEQLVMPRHRNKFGRFVDSFKPKEIDNHKTAEEGKIGEVDHEQATGTDALAKKLKPRHLQMIAIGGSIGTGLFVGSGNSLAYGGPAALLIDYSVIGIMLFCTVHALGELAIIFPVAGSFSQFGSRMLDPAWGFAMGSNYALQWFCVFPLELTAASMVVDYWPGATHTNPAAWLAIFWVVIVSINFVGVRGYAEAEFAFSFIKVIAVIGFIILGIVLVCGGGPNHKYIGGHLFYDPGAFSHSFKGVCSVFVTAAFSFSGTELVGLAAAETADPRKSLPSATKQVFWRITLFYIISLCLVGLLVPYNDPNLLNGSSSVDAHASPFVIAIKNANIKGLPSVMNAVILISVLSVGNSSIYGSSRTMAALADQKMLPKIFGYIDREGRPLVGIIATSLFGLLGFVVAAGEDVQAQVFDWLLALSGLSSIFTWGSICLCHIRFRRAWKLQGYTLDEIPFKSACGVLGSWVGFIINCLVLVAQFWVAVWPIGVSPNASDFFQAYLAAPIVLVSYICWKIYFRTPFVRAATMDLVTGRRETDLDALREEIAAEKAEIASHSWFYRVYKFWC